jgi:hypothetical protein
VPLRLLARAAPFVLGAVAAAIWLRRRATERPALPQRTGAAPPPGAPAPPAAAAPAAASARPRRQSTRFVRASERRPIDIVTVVDDLLGTGR